MSAVAAELEETLSGLDTASAATLERLVRDALALARQKKPTSSAVDAKGWPVGHFEKYAGCLAGDDWQPPEDPPPEPVKS